LNGRNAFILASAFDCPSRGGVAPRGALHCTVHRASQSRSRGLCMYVLYAVCFSLAYGMRQLLEEQQTSAQFDRRRLSGSGVTFQKWLRCGGRLCDEEARCCAWCVVFNLLQCVSFGTYWSPLKHPVDMLTKFVCAPYCSVERAVEWSISAARSIEPPTEKLYGNCNIVSSLVVDQPLRPE
jgi:hypothetical protein